MHTTENGEVIFATRTFEAIDYLLKTLNPGTFPKVRTEFARTKGEVPVNELRAALDYAGTSRGERAVIETILTLYNGAEYLHKRGNVLRHIMETDTPTGHHILNALMYVKNVIRELPK